MVRFTDIFNCYCALRFSVTVRYLILRSSIGEHSRLAGGPWRLRFLTKLLFGEGDHGVLASSWAVELTLMRRAYFFPCEGECEALALVDEGANFYVCRLFIPD